MLKVAVLCVLFVGGSYAFPEGRIVNGTEAKEGEIPYIVSFRVYNSHKCAGTILDATHILTAAHCVYDTGPTVDPHVYKIQYGVLDITTQVNLIGIVKLAYHEDFEWGGGYFHDVAVLKLEKAIPLGGNVQVTKLAPKGTAQPAGTSTLVSGWGVTVHGRFSNELLTGELDLFSDSDCETMNDNFANRNYHVCAGLQEGGRAECNGDSGGPLYAEGVQIGVVSWSYKPCGQKGRPGVYARVEHYVDWIADKVKNL